MKRVDPGPAKPDCGDRKSIDDPRIILAILFLVAGVFGIPLLWASRGFATVSKTLLTIAVSLYTLLILWVFWLIMTWCYQRIIEAW